jgi:peptide chain release factor 1
MLQVGIFNILWAHVFSFLTDMHLLLLGLADSSLVTPQLESKLKTLSERHDSLLSKLNNSQSMDNAAIASVSKEASELAQLSTLYSEWTRTNTDLDDLFNLLSTSSNDQDMLDMAREEHEELTATLQKLEKEIVSELVPKDTADEGSAILEIRAGAGGDEAALFAGEMVKMYERFAQERRWKWELLTGSELEGGSKGYKVRPLSQYFDGYISFALMSSSMSYFRTLLSISRVKMCLAS